MTQHREDRADTAPAVAARAGRSASTATPPPSAAATGQIDATGAQGVFVDDRRVVSRLHVQLGDDPSSYVASASRGNQSQFWSSARHLGTPGADPTVEVHRTREVGGAGLTEQIRVASRGAEPVTAQLVVRLAGDGADISASSPGSRPPRPCRPRPAGAGCHLAGRAARSRPSRRTRHRQPSPPAGRRTLRADLPGQRVARCRRGGDPAGADPQRTARTSLDADAGSTRVAWTEVQVEAEDPRLAPTVTTSFADLQHLLLTDPAGPIRHLRRRRKPLVPHAVRP